LEAVYYLQLNKRSTSPLFMLKKFMLSAAALLSLGTAAQAQAPAHQPCLTDQVNNDLRSKNPLIAVREAELEAEIRQALSGMDLSRYGRYIKQLDSVVYHIPVVFHVVHNYGAEYVSDNEIYQTLNEVNQIFMKRNADSTDIIPNYAGNIPGTDVKYAARANIMFHMASRDPQGQPTNGITRQRSYLTNGGGENAKLGQWAPDSYVNIWIVGSFVINSPAAAYAIKPASADVVPFYDGVNIAYTANGGALNEENTTAHELGHILNLDHPFNIDGQANQINVGCGDDNVDDTPPTNGGDPQGGCSDLVDKYDTTCTQVQDVLGKTAIDLTRDAADRVTARGITFLTRTRMRIRSVDIYTSDTLGSPFTIQLRRNGVVLQSFSGTVDSGTAKLRTVPVNFDCPADSGYSIVFSVNPNAHRDSLLASFPAQKLGVARILNASTDGMYNYFYNWRIQHGYFKTYSANQMYALYEDTTSALALSRRRDGVFVIDYPDTVNSQNVMDYTYCSKMYTHGQALRMRASLQSNIGRRRNLVDSVNQTITGIRNGNTFAPERQDAPPVAAYYVTPGALDFDKVYLCPGTQTNFVNRSWGDTISSVSWTFSNGASTPTSTSPNSVINRFSQPGYVTVSLTANSNAGTNTFTGQPVYVADTTQKLSGDGLIQEFSNAAELDRFPMFNHYNNQWRWERTNVGFYDNSGIRYRAYDDRSGLPATVINSPGGDIDDLYTPPYDLTALASGQCNLQFYYSAASRTAVATDINDILQISYSTTCGDSWTQLTAMTKSSLNNMGVVNTEWTPASGQAGTYHWALASFNIPAAARTGKVLFRFRYRPGITTDGSRFGTGNNFYMDRLRISPFPAGVDETNLASAAFALSPNPTQGGATVVLKAAAGQQADLAVTDVTGKVVYRAAAAGNGGVTQIEIPAAAIAVKGVYFVQVTQGTSRHTEKMVVY